MSSPTTSGPIAFLFLYISDLRYMYEQEIGVDSVSKVKVV